MNYSIKLLAILSLFWMMGCTGQKNNETKAEQQEDKHAHDEPAEDMVHLVTQQMEVMEIEMGSFTNINLSSSVKSNGRLELPPHKKALVSSMLAGKVASIDVLIGQKVTKGQILAYLENPSLIELQEEFLQAFSNLEFQKTELQRAEQLYADSATSLQAVQDAQNDYNQINSMLLSSRAQLELLQLDVETITKGELVLKFPIKAPIPGFIHQINTNIGVYTLAENDLFTIVDNDHIHIDLRVYEKDIQRVEIGQEVDFTITSREDSLYRGRIFSVGKSFEDDPKAILVHAEIDNPTGNLLPGMYVDARIITNSETVMALPNDAIVNHEGLDYIFAMISKSNEEGHKDEYIFKKIEVNTGVSDMGFTHVVPAEYLPEEIKVVTKGAYYLMAEMNKGAGGHGHHH
jgi:cobalt-zinc-cadmium efflux system membrane fusion protein